MRALLDVNVLIALLDGEHLHHRLAAQWLQAHGDLGWASCPLTQNGCLRIISLPNYPHRQGAALVAQRLTKACAHPSHEFWPDSVSLLDDQLVRWDRVLSSRQITDLYLLTLAARNEARLVTFDQHLPLHAARQATSENLLVLKS